MLRLALIVFAVLWLAPALLVTAGGASPLVFLVLLAILGFYYGRSRGDWGSLAAQLSSGRQAEREPGGALPTAWAPALVASGSERLRRRVEGLEDRRSELIERLPADPLECPQLVSCLAVLTHELAGDRDRVEEEYRGFALVKLDHAWRALEKGDERPRTAMRLAGEVGVAASALEERLRKLADLPADLERDRRAFCGATCRDRT